MICLPICNEYSNGSSTARCLVSIRKTFEVSETSKVLADFPIDSFHLLLDTRCNLHILFPIPMHNRFGFYYAWFYFTFATPEVELPRVPSGT